MNLPLIEQIVDWLDESSIEEKIQYSNELPMSFWKENPDFEESLISQVRFEMVKTARDRLHTNAGEVLPEREFHTFLLALKQYSPVSVLARFQKKAPKLTMSPISSDAGAIAGEIMNLWDQAFVLLVARPFTDLSVLLGSLLRLNLTGDQIKNLYERIVDDRTKLEAYFDEAGYKTPISITMQAAFRDYFAVLTFYPKDFVESILSGSSVALYGLLGQHLAVVEVLAIITTGTVAPVNEDQAKISLLKKLVLDAQYEAIKDRVFREKSVVAPQHEEEISRLYIWLESLFTNDGIKSGSSLLAIKQYIGAQATNKAEVVQDIIFYITHSGQVISLFEGYDVEDIIDELRRKPVPTDRLTYVKSFEPDFDADVWPVAQGILTILAEIA